MEELKEGSVVVVYLKQRAHWLIGKVSREITEPCFSKSQGASEKPIGFELVETAELHYIPTRDGLGEMMVCHEVLAEMPVRILRGSDILGECVLSTTKFPTLLQNYEQKIQTLRAAKSGLKLL